MTYRFPKSYEVFGNTVRIKGKKNLTDEAGEECWGLCRADDLTIWVDSSLRGDKRNVVLCHEAVHMVLDLLGYDSLSADEVFVDRLGQVLHQALKTACFRAVRKSVPLSEGSPSDSES